MRIEETIDRIKPLDEKAMKLAKERQDFLTKPKDSLGILEKLSIQVAGITGNPMPKIRDKVILTMAGDHGVVEEEVSAFPKEVTLQMVDNFIHGGAAINVLARHIGARVMVVDMGVASDIGQNVINKKVGYGTKNIARGAAMSYDEAIRSVEAGVEVLEEEIKKGVDIVGIGDMGIGNTTASSAIVAAVTGESVEKVTGRGTGIKDEMYDNKIRVIKRALEVNSPDKKDPLDVLAKVGGFEIGGLAGVILGAAAHRIPVVMDGFISAASGLLATELAPLAKKYLIASHNSVEIGHRLLLKRMGLRPLLDLNMRLGEGTGAALGIGIVEASVKILTEMATFEDAGVSRAMDDEV
ncbi:MAG: nicotinate-nucleotide--dimethylbenzimidazole phosphoribosyltransferase [Methanocellales archaeon]|nr:nicotinate-nucleotide--dimethylbenzimidazole phosphoribosyltransferase [Methanocellales archaeon]MDD3291506.1 nicotinate-nucleotide--dimethylbenzimidazole phosphoribosyltransferase [Methanocellales archaeon]MDD5234604.1 nicotinate-nucleotide--dimethylbenzimidazole phosphoribosyltransferase [Methanocellales archaeon]MDD5485043.1 nicotinate-nucleotide--dimethylbenzimidazole phosphoribosyltransferase [Methanocellales archaeon]